MQTRWMICMIAVLCGCLVACSYSAEDEERRACGHVLADMLALVCKERGYNNFFRREDPYNNRRKKRGIVQECCRRVCSLKTLEQYCSPVTTEAPDYAQIRKRSGNDKDWQREANTGILESVTEKIDNGFGSDGPQQFRSHLFNIKPRRNQRVQELITNTIDKKTTTDGQVDPVLPASVGKNSADLDEINNENNRRRYETGSLVFSIYRRVLETSQNQLVEPFPASNSENEDRSNDRLSEERSDVKCNSLSCKQSPASRKETDNVNLNVFNSLERSRGPTASEERSSRYKKIRHRNHHNKNHTHKTIESTSRETKAGDARPSYSQVGTMDPYFMTKGLVHPHVKPAVRFSLN